MKRLFTRSKKAAAAKHAPSSSPPAPAQSALDDVPAAPSLDLSHLDSTPVVSSRASPTDDVPLAAAPPMFLDVTLDTDSTPAAAPAAAPAETYQLGPNDSLLDAPGLFDDVLARFDALNRGLDTPPPPPKPVVKVDSFSRPSPFAPLSAPPAPSLASPAAAPTATAPPALPPKPVGGESSMFGDDLVLQLGFLRNYAAATSTSSSPTGAAAPSSVTPTSTLGRTASSASAATAPTPVSVRPTATSLFSSQHYLSLTRPVAASSTAQDETLKPDTSAQLPSDEETDSDDDDDASTTSSSDSDGDAWGPGGSTGLGRSHSSSAAMTRPITVQDAKIQGYLKSMRSPAASALHREREKSLGVRAAYHMAGYRHPPGMAPAGSGIGRSVPPSLPDSDDDDDDRVLAAIRPGALAAAAAIGRPGSAPPLAVHPHAHPALARGMSAAAFPAYAGAAPATPVAPMPVASMPYAAPMVRPDSPFAGSAANSDSELGPTPRKSTSSARPKKSSKKKSTSSSGTSRRKPVAVADDDVAADELESAPTTPVDANEDALVAEKPKKSKKKSSSSSPKKSKRKEKTEAADETAEGDAPTSSRRKKNKSKLPEQVVTANNSDAEDQEEDDVPLGALQHPAEQAAAGSPEGSPSAGATPRDLDAGEDDDDVPLEVKRQAKASSKTTSSSSSKPKKSSKSKSSSKDKKSSRGKSRKTVMVSPPESLVSTGSTAPGLDESEAATANGHESDNGTHSSGASLSLHSSQSSVRRSKKRQTMAAGAGPGPAFYPVQADSYYPMQHHPVAAAYPMSPAPYGSPAAPGMMYYAAAPSPMAPTPTAPNGHPGYAMRPY
ncbi:hypothetical protein GGF31_002345 [Allomyces arbusculus]|nr:hypothetical protein GGF31_002345 [Allomyces arbusculus]